MSRKTLSTAALSLLIFTSFGANAAAPVCTSYCEYVGTVSQLYVNKSNRLLLYFDTSLNVSTVPSGWGVTNGVAAIYPMTENTTFGNALYGTLLAAQARGVTVKVQMLTGYAGYVKIDRIWIAE